MQLIASLFMLASTAAAHAQAPVPAPGTPPSAPPVMHATTPGLAGYTDNVLFGEVWKRPGLALRDRSLVTIAALVATGHTQQLTGHASRGLDNGVTPAEIIGTITQLAFYAGWPAAVSALPVVDEVFKQRGVDRASLQWPKDVLLPLPASESERAALVDRTVAPVAPGLAELTTRVLFNDLWRRPDLLPRDRSLVTIAALIATGDADQLAFHIARGLENGLTRVQLGEVITHLAFYAGWPKAMAAIPILAGAIVDAPTLAKEPILVTRGGTGSQQGPASQFIGTVHVDTRYSGTGDAGIGGARVTFKPGARTAWHTHPLGQTLFVVSGHGLVQRENGPVERIGPGDVVWLPPGVKHWHGVTSPEVMTHFAVSESLDGRSVEWLEQVSDADYQAAQSQGDVSR